MCRAMKSNAVQNSSPRDCDGAIWCKNSAEFFTAEVHLDYWRKPCPSPKLLQVSAKNGIKFNFCPGKPWSLPYVLTLDSILLESEQAVQKKDSFGSSMFFNALSHQHFSWQSAGYAKALLNLPSQEVQQPPISGSQVPKSPHWQRSSL